MVCSAGRGEAAERRGVGVAANTAVLLGRLVINRPGMLREISAGCALLHEMREDSADGTRVILNEGKFSCP